MVVSCSVDVSVGLDPCVVDAVESDAVAVSCFVDVSVGLDPYVVIAVESDAVAVSCFVDVSVVVFSSLEKI